MDATTFFNVASLSMYIRPAWTAAAVKRAVMSNEENDRQSVVELFALASRLHRDVLYLVSSAGGDDASNPALEETGQ